MQRTLIDERLVLSSSKLVENLWAGVVTLCWGFTVAYAAVVECGILVPDWSEPFPPCNVFPRGEFKRRAHILFRFCFAHSCTHRLAPSVTSRFASVFCCCRAPGARELGVWLESRALREILVIFCLWRVLWHCACVLTLLFFLRARETGEILPLLNRAMLLLLVEVRLLVRASSAWCASTAGASCARVLLCSIPGDIGSYVLLRRVAVIHCGSLLRTSLIFYWNFDEERRRGAPAVQARGIVAPDAIVFELVWFEPWKTPQLRSDTPRMNPWIPGGRASLRTVVRSFIAFRIISRKNALSLGCVFSYQHSGNVFNYYYYTILVCG